MKFREQLINGGQEIVNSFATQFNSAYTSNSDTKHYTTDYTYNNDINVSIITSEDILQSIRRQKLNQNAGADNKPYIYRRVALKIWWFH